MRNGGRDRLAMQVLLRFHKGQNKEIVLTWFPFVEEKLPLLCPISKLLAKAILEGGRRLVRLRHMRRALL